jgi:eukaryotic-like serine/threonine-protein kinase
MTANMQTDLVLGNRYRLLHEAGKGGMALVYEAYDMMLERPVAVKLLKRDFVGDAGFRERFRQEAKSAANLSHPNIVTVHDFGIDDNGVYIVMEFVSGTDLKSKFKENGLLSLEEGIPLIIQACAGLGYAHRAGIVHCDVKPQNILVTRDNRLKITDFGIARALSTINPLEKADVVWGSPQYISPEQAAGTPPSPASDVYSLGVVIYEMFTNHLPFDADDTDELASMRLDQDPPSPRYYNPNIPESLEKIILKVLSKEPSQRYRTADQLGQVISTFSQQPISAYFTPPPLPKQVTPVQSRRKSFIKKPDKQFQPDVKSEEGRVDWKTIWLELACILFVGGLIPFWLYVWLSIRPLIH